MSIVTMSIGAKDANASCDLLGKSFDNEDDTEVFYHSLQPRGFPLLPKNCDSQPSEYFIYIRILSTLSASDYFQTLSVNYLISGNKISS